MHSYDSSFRSSHQRRSTKKGVLRNLSKSTGITCARVSFLTKLQAPGLQFYLKRDSGTGYFSVNFAKFLRMPFLYNTSGRLLLILFRVNPYLNIFKMLGPRTHKKIFKKAYEMEWITSTVLSQAFCCNITIITLN